MSDTQQRLDLYKAAEARILERGFSVQLDQRRRQEAELAEIRKGIAQLQAELQRESAAAAGRGGLRYSTAVFCRR